MSQLIAYVFHFILMILQFYRYVLIASVILSWLLAFNVINTDNEIVYKICYIIRRATDPLLEHIRKILPTLGGLDFSPIVAFFVLGLVEMGIVSIANYLTRLFY